MDRTTRRTAAKGHEEKRRKVDTCPPEEDDGLNLADKIMSIELISREVFRRLDFKDLLNCSLVNRTWRASARLHLRSHRRCFLPFSPKTMELKQKKFIDLYDLLTNSSDVPFNGISITTPALHSSHRSNKESFTFLSEDLTSSSEDVSSAEDSSSESEEISSDESAEEGNEGNKFQETGDRFISASEWKEALGRVEVKYLKLDWRAEPVSPTCRLAIKEIFRRSSSTLVDLTVLRWDNSRGVLHFFGVNVLPNVKVLQLPRIEWRRLNAGDLEHLLNALPCLHSIRGPVDPLSLPAFVRTNKQHVIHEFNLATYSALELEARNPKAVEELLEIVITFARSQPKLTKVTLLTKVSGFMSHGLLTPEEYFRVLEALVQGGAEVLKKVEISYGDLLQLGSPSQPMPHVQRHSPPLFPAVTHLSLHVEFGILTDLSSAGVKNLNLEAHFPLLQCVELDCLTSRNVVPLISSGRTGEYCCKSVRRLVVRSSERLRWAEATKDTTWMASFTRLFPMVWVLVLKDCMELEDIIESMWGQGGAVWEELRVLRLEGIDEETMRRNWERLFTGLSRKDCVRLKRQSKSDDQFVEQLRLKPQEERKGSLLDLKKLKKLQLGLDHDELCENGPVAGKAFATTLTGKCVFSLMGLRIEIKRRPCQMQLKCRLALTQLKPFVHFVDKFTN